MYIFYSGPDDCYASAGVSKRNGTDTSVDVLYLGRVLDKEAGIYKSRERGIGFITRIGSGDKVFKDLVSKELPNIDRKEYFVKYEDRYLFIIKKKVLAGSNDDNPAWMYLGLDCGRMSDEQHKLLKRAKRDSLSVDEVYEAMQTEGVFGILSGEDYTCEEILPAYYQRQAAEQIFDFAKNYTKLLPLRVNNDAPKQKSQNGLKS